MHRAAGQNAWDTVTPYDGVVHLNYWRRSLKEFTGGIIALIFVVWLVTAQLPFETEITVYPMFCVGGKQGTNCPGEEETANRTTYKVFKDQQMVSYWNESDEEVRRFGRCAVRDTENWTCQHETATDAEPSVRFTMIGGEMHETATAPYKPISELFYPVTKWRWRAAWIAEHIRSVKH